jgi:hypothetical protein
VTDGDVSVSTEGVIISRKQVEQHRCCVHALGELEEDPRDGCRPSWIPQQQGSKLTHLLHPIDLSGSFKRQSLHVVTLSSLFFQVDVQSGWILCGRSMSVVLCRDSRSRCAPLSREASPTVATSLKHSASVGPRSIESHLIFCIKSVIVCSAGEDSASREADQRGREQTKQDESGEEGGSER